MRRSFLPLLVLTVLSVFLAACEPLPGPALNNTSSGSAVPPDQEVTVTEPTVTVKGEMVTYFEDVEGYYAQPDQDGDYPGVVLIHEWWGLNDNMKMTAAELAKSGYRVLAVDLYHGSVANNTSDAQLFMGRVDNADALSNMQAAVEFLHDEGAEKVGSWGYCFGGGQSALLALDDQTEATVIYYGNVQPALMQPQKVKAPVFMVYGDQDTSTPAANAQQLETKLKPYGIKTELHVYPGVGHAFANPSNPGHNEAFTQDAWTKTVAFLDANLKG